MRWIWGDEKKRLVTEKLKGEFGMSMFVMKEREVELDDSWDVIVIGGGPAGCTAAAAAGREGAKTLLIESTFALGGMGTSGLVPAWCPFTDDEKIIYKGMAERVLRETMAGMPHLGPEDFDWTPIDPERLKRVYDELVTEYGVTVLFGSMLSGVEMKDGGKVDTIIVANKAGLSAYRADVYVDCTGDGDLAAWAGAEYEKGNEDGDLQPATHCFILSNVDMYGYKHCGSIKHDPKNPKIKMIVDSGKYPEIPDQHSCNNIIGPGTIGFNAGHIWNVDNTDPASISKAMMQGRKMAAAFRDALAEFFPEAFANAFVVNTGTLMGIRETRRILGDYYLTVDDFVGLRTFEDEICRNHYFVDVHHKKSEIGTNREGMATAIFLEAGKSHGIPYRCLTPRGLSNVLVAGRSISTDRSVQGSTRVMPVCLAMGEAAGIAAAMTKKGNGDIRGVDTCKLREKLRGHGAYLPENNK